MSVGRDGVSPQEVIQAERRKAVEMLQELTVLKRKEPPRSDLGWAFLLDSLIFQTEARVRWLDDCETRLRRHGLSSGPPPRPRRFPAGRETSEVSG